MRVIKAAVVACLALGLSCGAYAETLQSSSYRIDESFIGGGGTVNSASPSYRADSAIGTTTIGSSTPAGGTGRQTEGGYVTTSDPALTFSVNSSSVSFGALSTTAASTATSTFSVTNYTSYGYIVQVAGSSPSNGSHPLAALANPTASQTGQEQFGINVVANTSPVSFGADPGPVGTHGVAATGYNGDGLFKYVSGQTIASAPKSSAQTNFTISYLVNAATTTPGGQYSGALTLICTGAY